MECRSAFVLILTVIWQNIFSSFATIELPANCGQQVVTPILDEEWKTSLHNRRPRVVGGVESNAHSWPWQVIVYLCGKVCQMICGGTLIGNQTVLTAGHCVNFNGLTPGQIKVRMGAHFLLETSSGEQNITVKRFVTRKGGVTQDIAVLHLEQPVVFSDTINAACVPSRELPPDTTCYVLGWGEFKNQKVLSPVLRQAPQKIQPANVCRRNIIMYNNDTELCASWKKGIDSCYGDSGGPLLSLVDNKWELHGIISFGPKIACGRSPGYYAKVFHYKNWIMDNL